MVASFIMVCWPGVRWTFVTLSSDAGHLICRQKYSGVIGLNPWSPFARKLGNMQSTTLSSIIHMKWIRRSAVPKNWRNWITFNMKWENKVRRVQPNQSNYSTSPFNTTILINQNILFSLQETTNFWLLSESLPLPNIVFPDWSPHLIWGSLLWMRWPDDLSDPSVPLFRL